MATKFNWKIWDQQTAKYQAELESAQHVLKTTRSLKTAKWARGEIKELKDILSLRRAHSLRMMGFV